MFWLMTVGVICLALGFVMGATFRQYRKPKVYADGKHSHSPPLPFPPPPSDLAQFEEAVDWVTRDKFFTVSGAHKAFRS